MSPELLTILLGAVVAVCGSVGTPYMLDRRKERRLAAREELRRKATLEENAEVSWEAINRTIVRERNRLQDKLDRQATSHTQEISQMRETHRTEMLAQRESMQRDAEQMRAGLDAEAEQMKLRYDEQIGRLQRQLAECQQKLASLYAEIHELQHGGRGNSGSRDS